MAALAAPADVPETSREAWVSASTMRVSAGSALALTMVLAGCLPGPDPTRSDVFVLDNDLPERVRFEVAIEDASGALLGRQSYDLSAGETIRREWAWGKGDRTISAQSKTGNATQAITLGIVPQYVQVTVAAWGVSISVLHGD